MNEETLLDTIFGRLWKGKYPLKWCENCNCFYIQHEECNTSSCGGGPNCSECSEDMAEFHGLTKSVFKYLTAEEIQTYNKIRSLKRHLKTSLLAGFKGIDWKYLVESGQCCDNDREVFPETQKYTYEPEII